MKRIRPIVVCVFQNKGRILVFEGFDPSKDQIFYRPLGGGIEFGERSEEALRREIREEIDAEIGSLSYLGTLENIFTFNGEPGHEIVQVYDGQLADRNLYKQTVIPGQEAEIGERFLALWKSLDEFGPGKSRLYPDGLLELLATA